MKPKDRKDLSRWQQMSAMFKCWDSVYIHPTRQCNQASMTAIHSRGACWPGPSVGSREVACSCPHQGLNSAV